MTDLDTSFQKLLGRQATDEERQHLWQVKDALDLGSNDALWLVLIALQHYDSLYQRMPERIESAACATLETFKEAAQQTAAAAAEDVRNQLATAVANTARDVARDVAATQKLRWIAGVAMTCLVALTTLGTLGYTKGRDAGERHGFVSGYEHAKDEAAAASWAATPAGQRARRFSATGSIEYLAACSQPGWRQDNGICYPEPAADGRVYGWRLR